MDIWQRKVMGIKVIDLAKIAAVVIAGCALLAEWWRWLVAP